MAHVSQVQCCFTSTETVGLLGTGAQDGHLDFHTAPALWRRKLTLEKKILPPLLLFSESESGYDSDPVVDLGLIEGVANCVVC